MRINPLLKSAHQRASSLVTTLLVIVVMTIIVTAFLQSMTMERQTSRSYLNRYRAELAADAASKLAMARIQAFLQDHPYNASGMQKDPAPPAAPLAANAPRIPVLTGTNSPNPGAADPFDNTYLISVLDPTKLPADQPATPALLMDDTDSIDLNIPTSETDTSGWIGSPVTVAGVQTRLKCRAPWIEVLADPQKAKQPDPTADDYNPVVARFAYWVEDETMKLDASVIGNDGDKSDPNPTTTGAFQRSKTGASLSDLDLGAIPLKDKKPLPLDEKEINTKILESRQSNPDRPLDLSMLGHFVDEGYSADNYKFHATTFSLSDELAGNGRRRANLNHIVDPDPTKSETESIDPDRIQGDLDDIAYVISGRHLLPGGTDAVFTDAGIDADGPLKDFGKRFYLNPSMDGQKTSGDPPVSHEDVYLLRIAANIRDYIDPDRMPTVITSNTKVFSKTIPTEQDVWNNGTEPIAVGKEAIPYLQEHAWSFRMKSMANTGGNNRLVTFTVDHYFEFYNCSTKPYTAPTGTKIKISNLPKMSGNSANVELNDWEMDISDTEFPAGKAVVVTTCENAGDDPENLIKPSSLVIRKNIPGSAREYSGKTGNLLISDSTLSGTARKYGFKLDGRNSAYTDYETEFLFFTPNGFLESHPFISLPTSNQKVENKSMNMEMTLSADGKQGSWTISAPMRNKLLVWSTSLTGNDSPSRSGDPRSVSEPLQLVAGSNGPYGKDQGRFFGNIKGDAVLPSTSSFGEPKIGGDFVKTENWPDFNPALKNDPSTAYALIADSAMRSIGELGAIYDPHRKITTGDATEYGSNGPSIKRARGGGRTLKIGQPDDLLASNAATKRFASAANSSFIGWKNAAWRLTDYFSAEPHEVVMSNPVRRGKLNINGVLRDGGVAFRAALRSFNYLPTPDGDTTRNNTPISDADIDKLILQLKAYLAQNGPMMERGELSQLDFFYNANRKTEAQNGQSTVVDRSREELFRRVAELITTRSAAYSVYAIGQAVRQSRTPDPNASDPSKRYPLEVLSTVAQHDIFWLDPKLDSQPNAVPKPEAKVTSYDYYPVYHITR